LLAHIIQDLPLPEQVLTADRLRLLRATIRQALPLPLQELADHWRASITQDFPVPLVDPMHGNVILADGTMLTALWQDYPEFEQALTAEKQVDGFTGIL